MEFLEEKTNISTHRQQIYLNGFQLRGNDAKIYDLINFYRSEDLDIEFHLVLSKAVEEDLSNLKWLILGLFQIHFLFKLYFSFIVFQALKEDSKAFNFIQT